MGRLSGDAVMHDDQTRKALVALVVAPWLPDDGWCDGGVVHPVCTIFLLLYATVVMTIPKVIRAWSVLLYQYVGTFSQLSKILMLYGMFYGLFCCMRVPRYVIKSC